MIYILTSICNKIRKTGEWPTTWTQCLVITLPTKGNLKSTLNRLQPYAEEIVAEEQPDVEREGAPQNKYLISGSSARNTCKKHRRLVQNYSRSPTRAFTLTNTLQLLSRENH